MKKIITLFVGITLTVNVAMAACTKDFTSESDYAVPQSVQDFYNNLGGTLSMSNLRIKGIGDASITITPNLQSVGGDCLTDAAEPCLCGEYWDVNGTLKVKSNITYNPVNVAVGPLTSTIGGVEWGIGVTVAYTYTGGADNSATVAAYSDCAGAGDTTIICQYVQNFTANNTASIVYAYDAGSGVVDGTISGTLDAVAQIRATASTSGFSPPSISRYDVTASGTLPIIGEWSYQIY